jgi:lipoprotein-releasing system permease protein
LNPESSFSQSNLAPVGVFGVQQEIDSQYLIADLGFVQDLINKESQVSSIDLKLHNSNMIDKVADEIQNKLGAKYLVQTRFQQQAFLYKIMNTEKLAVLLILIFILIISTFNMIGSLTMLITQKTNDLRHLESIGLENKKIRNIFYYKGYFTIISGAFFGLFIGVLFAFLQYEFGLISMGEGSFVINSYPVLIKPLDVFLVFLTVTFIGILSTFFTVRTLLRKV